MTPQEKYITELITPYLTGEHEFSALRNYDGSVIECLYNGPNGAHCAFARVCEEPEKLPEIVSAGQLLEMAEGAPKLKPEAAALNMSPNDWSKVQNLHDTLAEKDPSYASSLNLLNHHGPFTELRAAIKKYINE